MATDVTLLSTKTNSAEVAASSATNLIVETVADRAETVTDKELKEAEFVLTVIDKEDIALDKISSAESLLLASLDTAFTTSAEVTLLAAAALKELTITSIAKTAADKELNETDKLLTVAALTLTVADNADMVFDKTLSAEILFITSTLKAADAVLNAADTELTVTDKALKVALVTESSLEVAASFAIVPTEVTAAETEDIIFDSALSALTLFTTSTLKAAETALVVTDKALTVADRADKETDIELTVVDNTPRIEISFDKLSLNELTLDSIAEPVLLKAL